MSLTIKQLSVTLDHKEILTEINLDISDGEVVSLLGQSGSGKTTLIKTIAGLIESDQGEMLLDGEDLNQKSPQERGIALVFQDLRLFPHLNVKENIAFPMKMAGIPRSEWDAQIQQLLADVKLAGFASRRISSLSGGQQQRVAIARALATKPRLLLLDEPFSGLDETLRLEMHDFIRRIQAQYQLKTLLITHDANEAITLSSRVAFLHDHRLQQFDTPEILMNHPQNAIVNRYFSKGNVIHGEVHDQVFETSLFRRKLTTQTLPDREYVGILSPNALTLSEASNQRESKRDWTVTGVWTYLAYTRIELTHDRGIVWYAHISNQKQMSSHYQIGHQVAIDFATDQLWCLSEQQYQGGSYESRD
ncbi:MAG: ABC transporter ATP-binding protein [Aerococcus sp.]|nr:ABC transporter ATP-binding protein [Aerococcus sp.]